MIRINLLPFRAARKRENIKRQISVYVLCMILLLVGMLYTFLQLNGKLNDARDTQVSLKKELGNYEKTIQRIDELDQRIQLIEKKLDVIKKLEEGKAGPVRLLDELAQAVPRDRLWLEALAESGGSLTLRGAAKDNETVADFMVNLEKAEHIQSVDLQSIQAKEEEGVMLAKFTLNCKTYAFQPEEPVTKGKKGRKRTK
jgi:type IV pilus assembly protein PilN